MSHLLVTNDYPPKIGGIQSYLYELWSRLPPDEVTVLTIDQPGAARFDAAASHRIVRLPHKMLLPTASVMREIDRLASEMRASIVLLDPALPIGRLGPRLARRYGVLLHGAEVTVPARLPGLSKMLAPVIAGAALVVAAGGYPAREARRLLDGRLPPTVVVPPGVDHERFRPLSPEERGEARRRLGLPPDARLVVSVSRLVPRKGFDVLIEAAAALAPSRPDLLVAIAGSGRDEKRLAALARRHRAPVRLLGRVPDDDLPALVGSADVAAMLCRDRWLGLEQEGFGIVFLEASSCAVAVLAGRSGGSEEAVEHERTGLVADRPGDLAVVTQLLGRLLDDPALRERLGTAGRARVLERFDYDELAKRLHEAITAAAT